MSPRGYKYTPSGDEKEKEKIEIPAHLDPQPKAEKGKAQEPQTFVVKTETDAYIHARLQNQPETIEEINAKPYMEDLAKNILELPKAIKEALDKRGLVPRWINKDKRMIDRALDQRGWNLFNRVYFPDVPRHYFTANGTVENGDSILGFMPAAKAEVLRKRPGQISQERINSLPINRFKDSKGDEKIGYYKPAYTAEPDNVIEKGGNGLYAQPDLPNQE